MRVFAVVVAFTCLLSGHAFGWGQEGHSIIAAIAQRRLTPQAAAVIEQLLGEGHSLAAVAAFDTLSLGLQAVPAIKFGWSSVIHDRMGASLLKVADGGLNLVREIGGMRCVIVPSIGQPYQHQPLERSRTPVLNIRQ